MDGRGMTSSGRKREQSVGTNGGGRKGGAGRKGGRWGGRKGGGGGQAKMRTRSSKLKAPIWSKGKVTRASKPKDARGSRKGVVTMDGTKEHRGESEGSRGAPEDPPSIPGGCRGDRGRPEGSRSALGMHRGATGAGRKAAGAHRSSPGARRSVLYRARGLN